MHWLCHHTCVQIRLSISSWALSCPSFNFVTLFYNFSNSLISHPWATTVFAHMATLNKIQHYRSSPHQVIHGQDKSSWRHPGGTKEGSSLWDLHFFLLTLFLCISSQSSIFLLVLPSSYPHDYHSLGPLKTLQLPGLTLLSGVIEMYQ